MHVTWLPDVRPRSRTVAIGQFDGVHLGHRDVIRGCDTVLTFEPHPLAVLAPDAAPPLLTNLGEKAQLISELGVRELVIIPFDRRFADQRAEDFVDDVLVRRLRARGISVGVNFRFGSRAAGDTARLSADTRFRTRVVPLLEIEDGVVSSTRIRAHLAMGDVDAAARLLGTAPWGAAKEHMLRDPRFPDGPIGVTVDPAPMVALG